MLTEKEVGESLFMRIEDREEYVDLVAQAVIDRIEERDRITGLVDLVVRRVLDLQQQQAALAAVPGDQPRKTRRRTK